MLCPVCNVDLKLSDRQGVEIDYCPQCRGVWLDRGEMEKIIERSTVENQGYIERSSQGQKDHGNKHGSGHGQEDRSNTRRDSNRGDSNRGDSNRGERKGGFLQDLFDF